VHNCGYGGGVGAMHAMDSSGSIPEEELQENVDRWRQANPKICKLWRRCETAARTAIEEHRRVRVTKAIAYRYQGGHLFAELPSGRSICYWHARINDAGQLVYMGVNQTTKQWQETETWGGKLVENLTQAVARDCLAEAMTRVDAVGYTIVMHIHDEMIVDVPVRQETAEHALDLINKAMSDPIDWAPGLPLKGDGYCCDYYRKD
jgi:DNA polymerase